MKNSSRRVAELEQALMKQVEISAEKELEQNRKLAELNTETIVLNTAIPVLTLFGIGAFVYVKKRLNVHVHGQPQQDPHNNQYRQAEDDAEADKDNLLKTEMKELQNAQVA